MGRWPASRTHADLFTDLGLSAVQQPAHRQAYVGRRLVVARSGRSRLVVVITHNP